MVTHPVVAATSNTVWNFTSQSQVGSWALSIIGPYWSGSQQIAKLKDAVNVPTSCREL